MGDFVAPGTKINGWTMLAGNSKADYDWALAHPKQAGGTPEDAARNNWYAGNTPANSSEFLTMSQPKKYVPPATDLTGFANRNFWEGPDFKAAAMSAMSEPPTITTRPVPPVAQGETGFLRNKATEKAVPFKGTSAVTADVLRDRLKETTEPEKEWFPGQYLYVKEDGTVTNSPTATPLYADPARNGDLTIQRLGDANRAVVGWGESALTTAAFMVNLREKQYPFSTIEEWTRYVETSQQKIREEQAANQPGRPAVGHGRAPTSAAVDETAIRDSIIRAQVPDSPVTYITLTDGSVVPFQAAPNASAYWLENIRWASIGQTAIENMPVIGPILAPVASAARAGWAGINLAYNVVVKNIAAFVQGKGGEDRFKQVAYNPITWDKLSDEEVFLAQWAGQEVRYASYVALSAARYLRSSNAFHQMLRDGWASLTRVESVHPAPLTLGGRSGASPAQIAARQDLIDSQVRTRESLRRQAMAMKDSDPNGAIDAMMEVQLLDSVDRPFDPYYYWSIATEPWREEPFRRAVAQYELQVGRPLKYHEIAGIAELYVNPDIEMAMGIVFDVSNVLPVPFLDNIAGGIGKAVRQIPIKLGWADEATQGVAARFFRWSVRRADEARGAVVWRNGVEALDVLGRTLTNESQLNEALDVLGEVFEGDLRRVNVLHDAIQDPRLIDKFSRIAQEFNPAWVDEALKKGLISPERAESLRKSLAAAGPANWRGLKDAAQDVLRRDQLDRLIRQKAKELGQEIPEIGSEAEARFIAEWNLETIANARVSTRQVMAALAGDLRDAFLRGHRVERGLNLYEDSLLVNIMSRMGMQERSTASRAAIRTWVRSTSHMRSGWVFATLALRPAWFARNVIDTTFRMMLGSPDALNTFGRIYDLLPQMGKVMQVPGAVRTSFTSTDDSVRNIVERVLGGERINRLLPGQLMAEEFARLQLRAGKRRGLYRVFGSMADAVKSFGKGFEDLNTLYEFTARTAKLWELYLPKFTKMNGHEISRIAAGLVEAGGTADTVLTLKTLWEISGGNPGLLDNMVRRLLGQESGNWVSVLIEDDILKTIRDMPEEIRESVVSTMIKDLEAGIQAGDFDVKAFFAKFRADFEIDLLKKGDPAAALRGLEPEVRGGSGSNAPSSPGGLPDNMKDVTRSPLETEQDVARHLFDQRVDPDDVFPDREALKSKLDLDDDELDDLIEREIIWEHTDGTYGFNPSMRGTYDVTIVTDRVPRPKTPTADSPNPTSDMDEVANRVNKAQQEVYDPDNPRMRPPETVRVDPKVKAAYDQWAVERAAMEQNARAATAAAPDDPKVQARGEYMTQTADRIVTANTRIRNWLKFHFPGPMNTPIEYVRSAWGKWNEMVLRTQTGSNRFLAGINRTLATMDNVPERVVFSLQTLIAESGLKIEVSGNSIKSIRWVDDLGDEMRHLGTATPRHSITFLKEMYGGNVWIALNKYLPENSLQKLIEDVPYSAQLIRDIDDLATTGVVRKGSDLEILFEGAEVATPPAPKPAAPPRDIRQAWVDQFHHGQPIPDDTIVGQPLPPAPPDGHLRIASVSAKNEGSLWADANLNRAGTQVGEIGSGNWGRVADVSEEDLLEAAEASRRYHRARNEDYVPEGKPLEEQEFLFDPEFYKGKPPEWHVETDLPNGTFPNRPPADPEYLRNVRPDEVPPTPKQTATAKQLWQARLQTARADNSTLAGHYANVRWRGRDVLESPQTFEAYLVDSIDAAERMGLPFTRIQAMRMELDDLRAFIDTSNANWATLGIEKPKWNTGYAPAKPRDQRFSRGTMTWVLENQQAAARIAQVRSFMEQMEEGVTRRLTANPHLARALPQDQLDLLARFGREAVDSKGRIIDVAMNGGVHPAIGDTWKGALPATNEYMLDYGDFTQFDKVMKSIYPFWMFPSRSTAFWAKYTVTHPWLPALYGKYVDWTKGNLIEAGFVNTQGDPLPSMVGMMRIPGTEIWFNPTSALSFRFPLMMFDRMANGESEEFSQQDPMQEFMGRIVKIGRASNLDLPFWITWPAMRLGMLNAADVPSFAPYAPLQLIPRTWLMSLQEKLLGVDQTWAVDFLHPDVAWKDYLIEVELYTDLLQRMETMATDTEKMAAVKELIAALGYQEDETSKLGYRLNPREDHPLWQAAVGRISSSEYANDLIGYFTGIFPKANTDGQVMLYGLRNHRNFLRDAINNAFQAEVFKLSPDAEDRYTHYIEDGFKTPWGKVAGIYNAGRFLQTPGGQQVYGQDRRELFAQALHEDEITTSYYDAISVLIEARDAALKGIPLGEKSSFANVIWDEYLAARQEIEDQPMYQDARRTWMVGHKPESLTYKHYSDQFWQILQETYPQWDQEGGEDFNDYKARVEEWKVNLPQLAQRLIKSMMDRNVIQSLRDQEGNVTIVNGSEVELVRSGSTERYIDLAKLRQQLLAEATPEGYDAHRKNNRTLYSAIDAAYDELYTNLFFSETAGLKGFALTAAQQDWMTSHPMPTDDQIVQTLLNQYGGRWSEAEIREAFTRAEKMSIEQRIAPRTEQEKQNQDVWDVLSWIGLGSDNREAFNKAMIRVGGDPASVQTWYDTNGVWGETGERKVTDKFLAFYDSVMKAGRLLNLTEPTPDQIKILAAAQEQNNQFREIVTDKFGEDFYSLLSLYGITSDKKERKELRSNNPAIDLYYDLRDEWAATHPVWVQFYYPDFAGGTASAGSGSGESSSGGGRRGGGGRSVATAGHWIPIGIRGATFGAGKSSARPVWPAGFAVVAGDVAISELERLSASAVPLSAPTVDWLSTLMSRHPEWRAFLSAVLYDQSTVSQQA